MEGSKLYILWTDKDKDKAEKVIMRYLDSIINKQQWAGVEVLLWGPSEELVANDLEINKKVLSLIEKGIVINACEICADEYGIADKLKSLGIKFIDVEDALTQILKQQKPFVSF